VALFRRSPGLPADVRARTTLITGEAILASAELVDGWAVAGTAALHVLRNDEPVPVSHAWTDVDGARLDPETAELTIRWVDGTSPTALHLADDTATAFPRALHERVQNSVVHSEKVDLSGGGVVRVVLRRGADDALFTQVIGTGDVDLADPVTAAAVDAAEARVRDAVGLR
jgi:hypothetical protein